ncbi:MAG: hypothetical protein ACYDHN_04830 [Solirubrobacteraceae bacterium]
MPESSGHELLSEWRRLMDAVVASATSASGRTELPGELLRATQRQLELVREVIDRERTVQSDLAARVFAPIDGLFDLLEETGATLSRQAASLEAAGVALSETAALMKQQAELFERSVAALRQPSELAKAAVGVKGKTKKPKTRRTA